MSCSAGAAGLLDGSCGVSVCFASCPAVTPAAPPASSVGGAAHRTKTTDWLKSRLKELQHPCLLPPMWLCKNSIDAEKDSESEDYV